MRRLHPGPLILAALALVPVWWLLTMSLKTNAGIAGALTLVPRAPTLENYAFILTEPDWIRGYLNALIYVAMNVVLCVGVAIPAAYALSRRRFRGHRPLFFGFLMFRMMAPPILLVPYVQIFSDLGMIDTHLAVALAHAFFNVPLAIWILEGFISAVPPEMDEAARVDGYGLAGFFRRILLPQIAPGVAVAAFFCFMFSWTEFLMANALTTVDAKPITGIMSRAGGVLVGDYALLAAASVLGLLPGAVLMVLMRNHLAQGFSMGRLR
jgi:glycerol transport system permease protein